MKKIMVVDDDKDLLVALMAVLKRQGYEVAVTMSCNEGLEILSSFKPNLILLDINVGMEDGRDMCRKIKSQAEHAHIPVILISANDNALNTYKEHGADSILKKPFDLVNLYELVSAHIA
jgi:two-component system response regulator VicR